MFFSWESRSSRNSGARTQVFNSLELQGMLSLTHASEETREGWAGRIVFGFSLPLHRFDTRSDLSTQKDALMKNVRVGFTDFVTTPDSG